ncbi:3-hydroxyacyl-[acyl-carrier-protein] dehydratase, FabZ form [Brevinematales bacterium NS]|jgi:3-hydroxyacyl-[acyl-carrier-protein] dehydratase|nr:3-hydroxyacyl-ACP dehydratase FabZ [Brevinematales bacterium]QJR22277.1 3-hydroxyacyl-[acyl-carrier-protein] dehydratase, FabZ form [Brevinematales bacterium NS]
MSEKMKFSINELYQILPHKYPFLLVDECYDIIPGKSGIGVKYFSINEWFFQGHFPGRPIVPGVLIIEIMAQVTAVVYVAEALGMQNEDNGKSTYITGKLAEKVGYLVRADVKFMAPVIPPAILEVKVNIERKVGNLSRVKVMAQVGRNIVADGFLDVSENK